MSNNNVSKWISKRIRTGLATRAVMHEYMSSTLFTMSHEHQLKAVALRDRCAAMDEEDGRALLEAMEEHRVKVAQLEAAVFKGQTEVLMQVPVCAPAPVPACVPEAVDLGTHGVPKPW